MSYGREQVRKQMMFAEPGAGETGATKTIERGTPAYSEPISMHQRGAMTLIANYEGDETKVYAEVYDPIGDDWIDIEGAPFLVDTLPAEATDAGRCVRVAGLPLVDRLRLKFEVQGSGVEEITINGVVYTVV